MNKIFIEAKDNKTSEYNFLKTMLSTHFQDKEVEFIFMGSNSQDVDIHARSCILMVVKSWSFLVLRSESP